MVPTYHLRIGPKSPNGWLIYSVSFLYINTYEKVTFININIDDT